MGWKAIIDIGEQNEAEKSVALAKAVREIYGDRFNGSISWIYGEVEPADMDELTNRSDD